MLTIQLNTCTKYLNGNRFPMSSKIPVNNYNNGLNGIWLNANKNTLNYIRYLYIYVTL